MSRRPAGEGTERASFESQLATLQESLKRLEQGELSLDESLSEYERGLRMLKSCYGYLEQAERKIELLTSEDGQAKLQDFEHEAWSAKQG